MFTRTKWLRLLLAAGAEMSQQARDLDGRYCGGENGKVYDIHIRATRDEWQRVHEAAMELGISISCYLHALAMISESALRMPG